MADQRDHLVTRSLNGKNSSVRHLLSALQGRLGLLLLAVFALSYLFIALAPFSWNPPRWEENGAQFERGGTLSLASTGMVRSVRSAPILDTIIERNELSLRMRIRSAEPVQLGPARIFTISADPWFRNLTLGQEDHDLILRLRTPATSLNGIPQYVLPDVFRADGWLELDLLIADNDLRLALGSTEILAESLPKDALRVWNPEYRAALGNELTWDRPWLGEITRAVIGSGLKEVDLLRTDIMERPSGFWSGNDWRLIHPRSLFRISCSTMDLVLNFLCFIPIGVLLATVRSLPWSLRFSICATAIGVLFVEAAQLAFAGRHPSAIDWILNVAGTAFGAWLACFLKRPGLADDPTFRRR